MSHRSVVFSLLAMVMAIVPGGASAEATSDAAFSIFTTANERYDVPVSKELRVDVQPSRSLHNEFIVAIRLDAKSTEWFCEMSQNNIGKPVAIVVGCLMVAKPYVLHPMCEGSLDISGRFNKEVAEGLAGFIRTGTKLCRKAPSS